MQVYVQKSTRTTLPRSSSVVSGGELSHPVAPPSDGSAPCVVLATRARRPRLDQSACPETIDHVRMDVELMTMSFQISEAT